MRMGKHHSQCAEDLRPLVPVGRDNAVPCIVILRAYEDMYSKTWVGRRRRSRPVELRDRIRSLSFFLTDLPWVSRVRESDSIYRNVYYQVVC